MVTKAECASSKAGNSVDELSKTDQQKQNAFSVLGCVTWWSHDAVGYHPAMSLFLENTSGHQILGGEIPFQGRFTDVRTGEVTVAREYRRAPIRDHERLSIFLRGPRYYELPIDSGSWPTIECKAMCRLNNTNVEDLFMVHLAQVTMTDEDAQAQLVAQAGRSPLLINGKINGKAGIQLSEIDGTKYDTDRAALPLHASPGAIADAPPNGASIDKNSVNTKKTDNNTKKTTNTSYPKNLPGVGNDFYTFDKLFGDAVEVQTSAGSEDLTWTKYKSNNLIKEVFVGSRNANKADVIIIVMARILKEKEIIPLAKLLTNCNKSDSIAPFTHSVKYLPAGRSEIMTSAFRENKILSFLIQNDSSTNTVIVASRLPGDTESALANYCRRVNFLKFLEL
jgi:hypothetical protein